MLFSLLGSSIHRLVRKKSNFKRILANHSEMQSNPEMTQVNELFLDSRLSIEIKLICSRKDLLGNSIEGTRSGLNTEDSPGACLH